ncbi:MAG: ATP-binding protein, partial [Lachnospiraceae bacterium]|nr:ATP-binding protein [Lachnospiraceae bacterium]
EQYIYEELLHNPNVSDLYYWISEATARIEFMFEDGEAVIPMEVNLDCNEKAQSLKVFKSRYEVPMAIRVTRDTINMSAGMLSLPLFSLWNL